MDPGSRSGKLLLPWAFNSTSSLPLYPPQDPHNCYLWSKSKIFRYRQKYHLERPILRHSASIWLFLPTLFHILNLSFQTPFCRTAGVIKLDFSKIIALSATISRLLWSRTCRHVSWVSPSFLENVPSSRQFFGRRKVEVMSEPLRAGWQGMTVMLFMPRDGCTYFLRKIARLAIACNDFKCSWQFGKETWLGCPVKS